MTYYKVKTLDFEGEIFRHGHIMKKELDEEPYPLGDKEPYGVLMEDRGDRPDRLDLRVFWFRTKEEAKQFVMNGDFLWYPLPKKRPVDEPWRPKIQNDHVFDFVRKMTRDAQKNGYDDGEELTEEEEAELDEFLRAFREYSENKASEVKDTIGTDSTGENERA